MTIGFWTIVLLGFDLVLLSALFEVLGSVSWIIAIGLIFAYGCYAFLEVFKTPTKRLRKVRGF